MIVTIVYDNANDVNRLITKYANNPIYKIERLSDKIIRVEYPDVLTHNEILLHDKEDFVLARMTKYYYSHYLSKSKELYFNIDKTISLLLEHGIKFKVLPDSSIILFNENLIYDIASLNNSIGPWESITPYQFDTPKVSSKINLSNIYHSSILSDIQIEIKSQIIPVHRLILISRSEFLYSYLINDSPDARIIEIDEDLELFRDLLDVIYGIEVPIKGLRTLELVHLIQIYGVKDVNVIEIIKDVFINKETEADLYLELLSKIYSYGMPFELVSSIAQNITKETDISILPSWIQEGLNKIMDIR